MHVLIIIHEI